MAKCNIQILRSGKLLIMTILVTRCIVMKYCRAAEMSWSQEPNKCHIIMTLFDFTKIAR